VRSDGGGSCESHRIGAVRCAQLPLHVSRRAALRRSATPIAPSPQHGDGFSSATRAHSSAAVRVRANPFLASGSTRNVTIRTVKCPCSGEIASRTRFNAFIGGRAAGQAVAYFPGVASVAGGPHLPGPDGLRAQTAEERRMISEVFASHEVRSRGHFSETFWRKLHERRWRSTARSLRVRSFAVGPMFTRSFVLPESASRSLAVPTRSNRPRASLHGSARLILSSTSMAGKCWPRQGAGEHACAVEDAAYGVGDRSLKSSPSD